MRTPTLDASRIKKARTAHDKGLVSAREVFGEALVSTFDPSGARYLPTDQFFAIRLMVKSKSGRNVPFVMNPAQWDFGENRTAKDIIVKARQLGFSTKIQADHYEAIVKGTGVSCAAIADCADNTAHLLDIFKRFQRHMPPAEAPFMKGRFPAGIVFPDRDSNLYIGTAGNRTWGRSKTVHLMHGSEVAYWVSPRSVLTGLLESIPFSEPHAHVHAVLESTANGRGGYFYELVQASLKGLNDWKVHFYPWWWDSGYKEALEPRESMELTDKELALRDRVYREEGIQLTLEQFKWRRAKVREQQQLFQQEYPESLAQAFLYSGRPRFDVPALEARINMQCAKPVYEDLPIYQEGNVFHQVRVYERPVRGREYVIGADTAEGLQITEQGETDYSAAVVRDVLSNKQVATVQGRFEPYEFAHILQQVGIAYNHALVGVERNNHGHAVLGFLIYGSGDGRIKPYRNIYVHYDDERPGWPTNAKTRPVMIDHLALEYRDPQVYAILDGAIVNEAMSFVITERGKAEAMVGSFDDLVIADAIAGQLRIRIRNVTEVRYEPVRIGDF